MITTWIACLALAATDELWVGGWNSHNVLRIDWETGEPIGLFVEAQKGGLLRSHSFSFGPDRNFYVTSYATSQILRYDGQTGDFIDVFVDMGHALVNSHTAFWNLDDTLLVSSEAGHKVNQYDGLTGDYIQDFIAPGEAGLFRPELMALGPDGLIYLTSQGEQVHRMHPETGFLDVFVEDDPDTPEDETAGLDWAHGITFGPQGNLYIASSNNNRVLRFDADTGAYIDDFIPAGFGGIAFPVGIQFGPDGRFYVASFGNSRIIRYDADGSNPTILINLAAHGVSGPLDIQFFSGPICKADFDQNGALDILDFVAFQLAFQDTEPPADCNADAEFNVLDFVCFQERFQQGCP